MNPLPVDIVLVVEGLHADFRKRHRKDSKRVLDAWTGLVERAPRLGDDAWIGQPIPRRQWPSRFADLPNLYLIPELPHRFRALYTVYRHPTQGITLRIEWMGDHREHDRLFGYQTS